VLKHAGCGRLKQSSRRVMTLVLARFEKKGVPRGAALGDNREATVSSAAVSRKQRPQYGATRDGTEAPKTLSSGNFSAKHRRRYSLVPCAKQSLE
jgi:hypothetical protein